MAIAELCLPCMHQPLCPCRIASQWTQECIAQKTAWPLVALSQYSSQKQQTTDAKKHTDSGVRLQTSAVMQLCKWYEADQLAPDGVACGRASSAGAALGMPVAVAVVSARVLAEVEGSKGCHPARLLLTDPSTTLAASVPKSAPRLTCSSPLLVSIHSRSALAGQLPQC